MMTTWQLIDMRVRNYSYILAVFTLLLMVWMAFGITAVAHRAGSTSWIAGILFIVGGGVCLGWIVGYLTGVIDPFNKNRRSTAVIAGNVDDPLDAAYDDIVRVIDQVKTDDRNLDTDQYASMICDAIRKRS